ncbi:MAG: pyrroline-5-carboxylate reductase [Pirellula sp.]|jgi:pyrroline-5-carboxylate reductase|nr:pyrroline-5-carboxylate reductase [Pirellula sp.]
MAEYELGLLGGGQMAMAIAEGVRKAGWIQESSLLFCEPNADQVARLQAKFPKATVVPQAAQLFDQCHRIVLAVKPQVLESIESSLAPHVLPHHLVISIVAGIPLHKLSHWLRTERIIRVMPNIAAQSLQAASGIAVALGVNEEDRAWCDRVFRSIGRVVHVQEDHLHAVTGVSGSGPAYVLMMIEAMSDGGVLAGLPRDVALQLATQTVLGAAAMVQDTGNHPALLREQVTSPAGTTIAALRVLEERGFRGAVMDAVKAAADRSRELAGPIRKTEPAS